MKKYYLLLTILLGFVPAAKARTLRLPMADTGKTNPAITYRLFKVDIMLGLWPNSSNNSNNGSVSFAVEPHYRLSEQFIMGLNIKGTGITLSDTYSSFLITGDYYFNHGKRESSVLLFTGAGLGVVTYTYTSFNIFSTNNPGPVSSSNLGGLIRAGLETGHFRGTFEYNITGNSYQYPSFTFGFFFGGGKKP